MPHIIIHKNQVIIDGKEFPLKYEPKILQKKLELLLEASKNTRRACAVSDAFLKEFGRALYNSIFPPSFPVPSSPVLLDIRERGLSRFPWELLRHQNNWLAKTIGVVRISGQGGTKEKRGNVSGPLKVLVALSSPLYKEGAGERLQPDPVNLRVHEAIFTQRLRHKRFGAAFNIKPHITRRQMSEELLKNYHVLHFVGHGNWGSLSLEDDYGCVDEIDSAWLKENLSNSSLYLALFNSCYTACSGEETSCAGIAKTLLDAGIPMVVGMQLAISEEAAQAFAHMFYRTLAEGKSVVEAITISRRAISNTPECLPWEWLTPVLFIQPDALCSMYLPFVRPQPSGARPAIKITKPARPGLTTLTKEEIFVGRRREMVELLKILSFTPYQPERAVLLKGPAGSGKTALALRSIERICQRVERIIFICGHKKEPPREIRPLVMGTHDRTIQNEKEFLQQLSRELKLRQRKKSDPQTQQEKVLRALAKAGNVLLVMDGMEHLRDGPWFCSFIKRLPLNCCILITSRYALNGIKARQITLPPLSAAEGELLARYRSSSPIEKTSLRELYEHSEGNPLLLSIFIAHYIQHPQQWRRLRRDLEEKGAGPLFNYFFAEAWQKTTRRERILLCALSLFPRSAPLTALEFICRDGKFQTSLARLEELSLVELDTKDQRAQLPPLGLHWTRRQFENSPLLKRLYDRQALFAARFLKKQLNMLKPHLFTPLIKEIIQEEKLSSADLSFASTLLDNGAWEKHHLQNLLEERVCQASLQAINAEMENILQSLDRCLEQPRLLLLRSLLDNLAVFLALTCRWELLTRVYQAALPVMRRLKKKHTESILLNNMGVIFRYSGEWPQAEKYFLQSLKLKIELGDFYGIAQCNNNLGLLYTARGEWKKARRIYKRNLPLFHRLKDKKALGQTYNNLAMVCQAAGEQYKGENYFHIALRLKEEANDILGKAYTLNNLGLFEQNRHNWRAAEKLYQESLTLYEKLGCLHASGQTYSNLALLHFDRKEYEKALSFYEKGLSIFNFLKDIYGIAQTYNNLGLVYKEQGAPDKALSFYRRSLEIKERLGDIYGIAQTYNNMGSLYKEKKDWQQARSCYRRSIELKYKTGDRQGMGCSYANLGHLELCCRNYKQALKMLERAANIFMETSDDQSLQKVMGTLFWANLKLQETGE